MGKAHIDARPLDNKVIDLARRERVRNSHDPAVAVVEGLASFDEPVTGPDLADAINLSRSYVRRRLRLLERQGRAVSRWGRGFDRHGRPYNVRTWRYIPPDDESAGAAAPTAAPADDPNTQGTFQHQGAES